MNYKAQISGQGPDVVFIHGWGMNSEVFRETAERLSNNFRIHLIDLPGFGQNKHVSCEYSLGAISEMILPAIPIGATIIGWSMGGLIALNIALKHQIHCSKLGLIACNAQFSQTDDWSTAMKTDVLNQFVQSLDDNYQLTLQRFLMLQARGGDNAKDTIRLLKDRLFQYGEPDQAALYGGLSLLKSTSFVSQLPDISVPTLLLFGRLDALVPVSASTEMANAIPDSRLVILPKAAHAPFLSHFEETITHLIEFFNER